MNKLLKKSLSIAISTICCIGLFAACSNSNSTNSQSTQTEVVNNSAESTTQEIEISNESLSTQSESSTDSEVVYPIIIDHAFGQTTIESKPERVATISWGNQDVALALGVVPVGFSEANFGVRDENNLLPWTAEKLKALGVDSPNIFRDTDGLDFEAIAACTPDVILAAYSGITEEDYNTLSKIAPVVAYKTGPWSTTWRDQIIDDSTGMGMLPEGEALIDELETLIQQKKEAYPELEGKKFVWVNFSLNDLSKFHVYSPSDPRISFLGEFGLTYPQSVLDKVENEAAFYIDFSSENADVLNDADFIIGYGEVGNADSEGTLAAIQKDSILGNVPAIKNGNVLIISNDTPLAAAGTPGPLSVPYVIDDYLASIAKALGNGNE